MRESTIDKCAEFPSEKQGTSAFTPISTTYSDINQAKELSCSQTTVFCVSSTTVVPTITSVSPVFPPESSTLLTCDAPLPVTSSGILEAAAFLSGITEYSVQGDFTVTSVSDEEVPVYKEESQIRLSTLYDDLHLSDSDSDDEASDSDTEYDNDLFDSSFTSTNDSTHVQARLSTINEFAVDFSKYKLAFENVSVDAASSDGESSSSSEDDSSSDTEGCSSDDDDSADDDSSSSQSEASSTDSDESDEITNDQLMHRRSSHKALDVFLPNCISSAGIANTEDLSYLGAKGQKRKHQDKGLHYSSKRRKIESPGRRKRPAPGSINIETLNRVPKKPKIYPDSQVYSCPNTCPCKTRGRADRIPSIDRTFKVIKPLYIKLLQSRTLRSHNLSHHQCCEKYCSFRWYRRRVPTHTVLDDYWASDLDVYNFSWGQWKDGEGYV